ncbi:hypothetical protein GCM10027271_17970 [Saccharopolyspora gloriosae]|uniref:DUF3800 domain-containing protein n=1 Tax=Saccharopolyspora gloriosae TaxID=455344 RepID=A0A840NGF6_9PSEU|nr:hypothetical protein [Saccharopolyspora gloriosae]MBB5067347.1 hypothetical protein [Saccharopolyspora gloriosae]
MFFAAYADESYDLDLGVYILTASLVDLTEAETIRTTLGGLRKGGQKLHWSKEPDLRREELAKVASAFRSISLATVGTALPMNAERARRKCLEAVLPEIEAAGTNMLVMESRQVRNDKLDKQTLAVCKRKRVISTKVHIEFMPGSTDALLWLPDIVCGAALAAYRGDERHLEQLSSAAIVIEVDAS